MYFYLSACKIFLIGSCICSMASTYSLSEINLTDFLLELTLVSLIIGAYGSKGNDLVLFVSDNLVTRSMKSFSWLSSVMSPSDAAWNGFNFIESDNWLGDNPMHSLRFTNDAVSSFDFFVEEIAFFGIWSCCPWSSDFVCQCEWCRLLSYVFGWSLFGPPSSLVDKQIKRCLFKRPFDSAIYKSYRQHTQVN